jgi:asparagine synthase (glutamine-hydrolysing)
MCGIVGQARSDRVRPDAGLIAQMCAALEHRGPDARGIHIDDGVGLGIQRLRVIDLVNGDQPIFNEDRSIAVVLNGEIYNYRDLRSELEARGHRFASDSDTEVIVHLYEEAGPNFVRSLHGMFGLAIWDTRTRRLVLARDRVGKKPLFYSERAGCLSFASELNALMQDPEIPRDVAHDALDAYLAYRYVPAPLSAFRAVRKLPPASVLVFGDGRSTISRYWQLDYRRKLILADPRSYDEMIRDQLRKAVGRRMVADVPIGAFLSGGVDSSAVVAAMAEVSSGPVKTFSIGFSDDRFNELPRARLVAQLFATDHQDLVVRPNAVELLPKIVEHYGEPFGDASAVPSFYLSQMTRRHVTVALDGDGGDENFAGYSHYAANLLLERLDCLPQSVRRVLGAAGKLIPSSGRIDSTLSRATRLAATIALTPAQRFAAYRSHLDGLQARELYTDEYRELVDGSHALDSIESAWEESLSDDLLDRMLDVDINTYLSGQLLTKIDIASMAHSLEARSPLLDHEMMEFAASLPSELKLSGSERKVAFRRALRGWIPDEILDGPKQGFELPLSSWFRSDLKEYAREILLDPATVARGYFKSERIATLLDRHADRTEDNSRGIWTLLVFELWHRRFIDEDRRNEHASSWADSNGHPTDDTRAATHRY